MRTTQWLSERPSMKSILTMIVNKAYKGVGITDGLICHSSVLLDSQYQLQSNIDCAVKTLWNCFRVVPLASAMGTRSAIAPMCILVKVRNSLAYLIFVISFTQAALSNSKFYTQKLTKNTPKHSKMSLKSKIYAVFCVQSGKFYT